jgi:hypothetical protein
MLLRFHGGGGGRGRGALEPFGLGRTVIAWLVGAWSHGPWSHWSHGPWSHSRGSPAARSHAGPLEPFGAMCPRTNGAARSWSHLANGSSNSRGTARPKRGGGEVVNARALPAPRGAYRRATGRGNGTALGSLDPVGSLGPLEPFATFERARGARVRERGARGGARDRGPERGGRRE